MRLFVSLLLIILGFACLGTGSYLYWQRRNPDRIKFNIETDDFVYKKDTVESNPVALIIESINISLPVISVNEWEVRSDGVSYLSTTPIPGTVGNSVLYGHNWKSILGNLTDIKRGDKILIAYENRTSKEFVVDDIQVVRPDQIEVLKGTADPKLTIYTCTGFLDKERFVVTATPSEDLAVGL